MPVPKFLAFRVLAYGTHADVVHATSTSPLRRKQSSLLPPLPSLRGQHAHQGRVTRQGSRCGPRARPTPSPVYVNKVLWGHSPVFPRRHCQRRLHTARWNRGVAAGTCDLGSQTLPVCSSVEGFPAPVLGDREKQPGAQALQGVPALPKQPSMGYARRDFGIAGQSDPLTLTPSIGTQSH